MTRYTITGTRPVAGHDPGATIDGEQLGDCDIEALILGGHLTPARVPRKTTPEQAPEEE